MIPLTNVPLQSIFRRRQRGQTIIVALIIMGLLLILGFVFLGIINRSLKTSSRLQNRSLANDLSEAGIRYAHEQLLRSEQGADWRGQPTTMIDAPVGQPLPDLTRDPDAFYLRPPANIGSNFVKWPGSAMVDRGGPDGLGPFFRVNFQGGRALVRVRYGPSDANIFRSSPSGPLRSPGQARDYVIIESVGREGIVNPNDPTALLNAQARRVQNYASDADFSNELNQFRRNEARFGGIQINRAFASIGIIETARFITDKYKTSTPADLGVGSDLGAVYRGVQIGATLPTVLGTSLQLFTFEGNTGATSTAAVPVAGSLYSNADLNLRGLVQASLNSTLGDGFNVAGKISGDNGTATLQILGSAYDPIANGYTSSTTNLTNNGTLSFNTKSPNFFSVGGLVRDGGSDRDSQGIPRDIGYKAPPSIETIDPSTHTNRYVQMTRESGFLGGNGNSGRYGHGQGVFVDNAADRQQAVDEVGRSNNGGADSLVHDWLNPNNAGSKGWRGFLYAPPGAYVQLLSDGFYIIRDSRAPQAERTWKAPDGTDSGSSIIRYRLGRGTDGRLHIVNTFTPGININANSSAFGASQYQLGQPFNGVLYFEGNVRVRGVIPTDVQISIVSNATIYIEGSITKGVTGNHWTATYSSAEGMPATNEGSRITRPSKSMCMLMAKDYVALNTTQFFGPSPTANPQPKENIPNMPSYDPILVRAANGETLDMNAQFVLDPNGPNVTNPLIPSQWRPFAADYFVPGSPSTKMASNLLIAHARDEGVAPATFIGLDVNAGLGTSAYQFPTGPTPPYSNGATPYNPVGSTYLPLYGLGSEQYQQFGKFEQNAFTLIDPNTLNVDITTSDTMTSTGGRGSFTLFNQGVNSFTLRPQSTGGVAVNDYVLGRFAITPHDVRIEASIYAEEGSFFVIPGEWFNGNPNDTWDTYQQDSTLTTAERDERRMRDWGSAPEFPFYGEPLDVRITIVGSVSENMPPPAAQQAEWMRKWGWIPEFHGATTETVPAQHIPAGWNVATNTYVPNLIITYDPVLATGRRAGFVDPTSPDATFGGLNDPATFVRSKWIDYNLDGVMQATEVAPLPPLPRLPVSPTLAYFGEVH